MDSPTPALALGAVCLPATFAMIARDQCAPGARRSSTGAESALPLTKRDGSFMSVGCEFMPSSSRAVVLPAGDTAGTTGEGGSTEGGIPGAAHARRSPGHPAGRLFGHRWQHLRSEGRSPWRSSCTTSASKAAQCAMTLFVPPRWDAPSCSTCHWGPWLCLTVPWCASWTSAGLEAPQSGASLRKGSAVACAAPEGSGSRRRPRPRRSGGRLRAAAPVPSRGRPR